MKNTQPNQITKIKNRTETMKRAFGLKKSESASTNFIVRNHHDNHTMNLDIRGHKDADGHFIVTGRSASIGEAPLKPLGSSSLRAARMATLPPQRTPFPLSAVKLPVNSTANPSADGNGTANFSNTNGAFASAAVPTPLGQSPASFGDQNYVCT